MSGVRGPARLAVGLIVKMQSGSSNCRLARVAQSDGPLPLFRPFGPWAGDRGGRRCTRTGKMPHAGARLAVLDIDWIVCRDQERAVVDGCVVCPADGAGEEGREINVLRCLDCRHLVTTRLDRHPDRMCSTET